MKNILFYIEEPVCGCYGENYLFGGEPMPVI